NELALKQLVTKGQSTRRMSRVAMTTETKPQEFVFRDESEVVKSSTDDTNATGGSTEYYEPVVEVFPPPIFSAISEFPGDLEPDTAKTYFDKNGQFEAVDSSRAYLLLDGVKKNQVTFKVNPNPKGLNASTVAEKVEELTVQLQKTTGKSVMSAGIGDKVCGHSSKKKTDIIDIYMHKQPCCYSIKT
ncbi:uncharacterized protein LOC111088646, partial [Limulus polyphemus]|uniref:Uncharacterized protein LOC111088646 n=1 Tax=Limulus polyphemus TaxID=6850 RepID=A0ABM1TGQ5_LIMPO